MKDNKQGVLEDKFERYYEDIDVINYRHIFTESVTLYRGKSFKKVLDIGSGIGSFLESIKPFGFDLYALEASEYGVKRLREKKINVKNFYLEKDKQLPYENNSFSLVVFNQVIEHIEKEIGQYYIQEIIRVLEPGGVAIVKSPSKYSRIWRTDPHHIYCWKPNELYSEVKKYNNRLSDIKLQRVPLEPWMLISYNESVIDTWHKHIKYPMLKKIFGVSGKVLDMIAFRLFNSDKMLAVSNVSFVKKIEE